MKFITQYPKFKHFVLPTKDKQVKVGFKKGNARAKYMTLCISISTALAQALGWKVGDRVVWGYNEDNKLHWEMYLDPEGWKLASYQTSKRFIRVQLVWPFEDPPTVATVDVPFDVTLDRRLRIYADGRKPIE